MAGTMSRGDLRADLKASLHDAASALTDPEDFDRCLTVAAEDLGRWLPRTLAATLVLEADKAEYLAPDDFIRFKMALWGNSSPVKPWDKAHPGKLPNVHHCEGILVMVPAPSGVQIALLGSNYRFFYFAGYSVAEDAAQTTVPADRRGLFLLRAQAEACKELAMRNVTKPVSMRDGISNQPRNGTPAALHHSLMADFLAGCKA